MSEIRQTATLFVSTLAISVLGLSLAAQAQNSPFAKKGKQAWETATQPAPTQQQPTQPAQYPYTTQPQPVPSGTYQPSGTLSGSSSQPVSNYTYTLPKSPAPTGYTSGSSAPVTSGGTPYPSTYSAQMPASSGTSYPAPAPTTAPAPAQPPKMGATYEYPTYNKRPALRTAPGGTSGAYYPGRTNQYPQNQAPQGTQYPQQAQTSYPAPRPQSRKRGWKDKLGLGNLAFLYEGYLKGGAAATQHDTRLDDGWGEDFILDGSVRGEVSAITQGGLEYGVSAELRGQYDKYRRGFGGRVGDCPFGVPECSGVTVDTNDFVLRGHTSRFYAAGENDAKEFEAQLESAHLFLRSSYGDVTIGRDDGAAYLFSLGAPSLLNVGASNNSVDYTGLDAVQTVNNASGFSEKITYTSPRLLGDQIGVGIQFGASYALDAEACGVDYCVRGNDKEPAGVLAPEIDDVMEFGVALDRKFDNGFSVEATATYARGSEQSTLDVFDDLQAFGLGLELGYMDWALGGSYLKSNNGLRDGDYEAMDVGLTWQPSKLGFTVGYGHAEDHNVGLTSDQAVAGVSYDWNDNFRLGAGVQYVNRDVAVNTAGVVAGENEDATSIFLEGRFTF